MTHVIVLAALVFQTPSVEQQQSGTTVRLQAVSAVNDRVAWASGTGGTYTRTVDGGATWRAGVVPGADSLEFRDVHGFDADRAVLLAAGPGDKSRLYQTSDGGAHWTLAWTNPDPKGFFDCIDFRGSVGVVVGDAVAGHFPLLKTTDGGRTWAPYAPPGAVALGAVDGEGAFAASGTCVVLQPDQSVWVGTAKAGRILRFGTDRADAFEPPMLRGGASEGISTLAFRDAKTGMAGGGDYTKPAQFSDNIAVTTDGGRTWSAGSRPPFSGAVFGLAYVQSRPATVVAIGMKGAAWSADNGKTWSTLDGNDYWGISFGRAGVGWISGPKGRLAKVTF